MKKLSVGDIVKSRFSWREHDIRANDRGKVVAVFDEDCAGLTYYEVKFAGGNRIVSEKAIIV